MYLPERHTDWTVHFVLESPLDVIGLVAVAGGVAFAFWWIVKRRR